MAVINITLDLEWIGEDGSLDETLKNEIANKVVAMASKSSEKAIEKMVTEQIKGLDKTVSSRLNEIMEDFFTKKVAITDQWGDVKKTTSVTELLKSKCDSFMTEKVDRDGNVTNYNGVPRTEYLANRICGPAFEKIVKDRADTLMKDAFTRLDATIKATLGDRIAKLAGLEVKE